MFDPNVIIPLQGYQYANEDILKTSAENGVCEVTIVLASSGQNGKVAFHSDLEINQETYYDTGFVDGNFSCTILLVADESIAQQTLKSAISRRAMPVTLARGMSNNARGDGNGDPVRKSGKTTNMGKTSGNTGNASNSKSTKKE